MTIHNSFVDIELTNEAVGGAEVPPAMEQQEHLRERFQGQAILYLSAGTEYGVNQLPLLKMELRRYLRTIPATTAFLAFDAQIPKGGLPAGVNSDEVVFTGGVPIKEYVQHLELNPLLAEALGDFPRGIIERWERPDLSNGVGKYRVLGYVSLLLSLSEVAQAIRTRLERITQQQAQTSEGPGDIIIVAHGGLFGGKGSNLAIYAALARTIAQNLQLNPVIIGVGVLPHPGDTNARCHANAWAALAELDLFQRLEEAVVLSIPQTDELQRRSELVVQPPLFSRFILKGMTQGTVTLTPAEMRRILASELVFLASHRLQDLVTGVGVDISDRLALVSQVYGT